jgi:hypothetical protein
VPESLVVDEPSPTVGPVAKLALIDAEVLGNNQCAHLVQDVVPGKRPEPCVGSGAPDHPQLVQLSKSSSCSLDAREVELIQLLGGENPMLVKVKEDELISFGDR